MSEPEIVYLWPGPPRIELRRADVTVDGRHWVQHWLVTQGGIVGAVSIIRHDDAVLLVRHWRPALGRSFWELPRGFGEPGDNDPAETARREISEEVGLRTDSIRVLATIWPDTGIQAGAVAVVEAMVGSRRPDVGLVPELDDVRWVSSVQIDELIRTGDLCDGISLAAFAVWHASITDPQEARTDQDPR